MTQPLLGSVVRPWGASGGDVGPVNLALYPDDFANAAWSKNGADTPITTANTITFGAAGSGNSGGYVFQPRDVFEPGVTYEFSGVVEVAAGTKAFRFASWDGNAEHQSADKMASTTPQVFTYSFTADALTAAGQDFGIRNAVGGGAGEIIVSHFFLQRL